MRLALPQAGLLLFQASPDAPDEDLKPGTRTRAYCLASFIFTIGFRFFQAKVIHRCCAELQLCANRGNLTCAKLELCAPPRLTHHLAVNKVAPLPILRQPYSACLLPECPNHLYGGKQPGPRGWCG